MLPRVVTRRLSQFNDLGAKTFLAASVQAAEQLLQKQLVLLKRRKVMTTPHHQRLIGCLLEAVMSLLNIAVLIRLAGLYLLATDPVVS